MRSALRALENGGSSEPRTSGPRGEHPSSGEPFGLPAPRMRRSTHRLSRGSGPCGYGGIAFHLGWGASRASAAETILRQAGRLSYDNAGRARLREL